MDAVAKMVSVCETPTDRALVTLLGRCGLRISEVRSLSTYSIDTDERVITVIGKGDKTREVPISSQAWEDLRDRISEAGPGEMLVPLSDRTARRRWKDIAGKAGLGDSATHDGRATVATAMHNKTNNIRVVQEFLGHASSKTTETYTAVALEQMREGVEL
ncbi:tyrosine recombinase/integrase [Rhodococcus phage ReqiDocB7]|uniref:tyrosine recombinase/integrase n=1 Tax=Rhodococcus phage ReqiDocB7 TaxID=691966 RepID=UPI0001CDD854|nr:tyrosine recombinase/integrase [Rhodococcus phage ReqiDocB7]ADD80845.1 tyrosine recombinase/integrase [Rhodococcus phage ReqiDocB7]